MPIVIQPQPQLIILIICQPLLLLQLLVYSALISFISIISTTYCVILIQLTNIVRVSYMMVVNVFIVDFIIDSINNVVVIVVLVIVVVVIVVFTIVIIVVIVTPISLT